MSKYCFTDLTVLCQKYSYTLLWYTLNDVIDDYSFNLRKSMLYKNIDKLYVWFHMRSACMTLRRWSS